MKNSKEPIVSKYLKRQITRRQVVKLGGVAALGLVFHKPLISSLTPTPVFANYEPPNGDGEGCTPGYWKNHTANGWPIAVTTVLGTVCGTAQASDLGPFNFGPPTPPPAEVRDLACDTFLTALQYGGGSSLKEKAQIMLRAAAAAYLNALQFPGTFLLTDTEVISLVDGVLSLAIPQDPQDYVNLGTSLDSANNDPDCNFFRAGPANPNP